MIDKIINKMETKIKTNIPLNSDNNSLRILWPFDVLIYDRRNLCFMYEFFGYILSTFSNTIFSYKLRLDPLLFS